jgi:multidrug resistance efflux pump
MDSIESLDALDEILKSLAARRLVMYLSDPDRRGALVTHGFHTPEELQGLRSRTAAAVDVAPSPPAALAAASAWDGNLAKVLAEIDSLKERTLGLEKEVAELKRQLGSAATNP